MTVLLPAAGQSLLLVESTTGARLTTIVDDDVAPDCLLVQPPVGTGGVPVTVPTGTALQLTWTSARGRHELDVVLVEVRHDRIPLWRLTAQGPTSTTQLRRYARAPDSLHGELTRGRDAWKALVSDLSEGGARALVQRPAGLAEGDSVLLYLTLEDSRLQLPGRLLPFVLADVGRTELRVEFDGIGRAADVLRRRVFARQVQARGVRERRSQA